jgi:hypothetical protein
MKYSFEQDGNCWMVKNNKSLLKRVGFIRLKSGLMIDNKIKNISNELSFIENFL